MGASPGVPTAENSFGAESWIAYDTLRTGGSVWLVHPDGSEDHELETGLAFYVSPDWSPDGEYLAFSGRAVSTPESLSLFEYDMDTTTTKQLFECDRLCVDDLEPAYSPDGDTVAFSRVLGPLVHGIPSESGIWVGDRETGRVRQLTSNPQTDQLHYVCWSPDAKHLAYQREITLRSGNATTAVFTIAADGTGERRLTKPALEAGMPAFSPDGEWIVFDARPLHGSERGASQIYRMHPDGSTIEQLTHLGDVTATGPKYSPDGDWIIFSAGPPLEEDIWAIPAGGGDPVVVADEGSDYVRPVWQP